MNLKKEKVFFASFFIIIFTLFLIGIDRSSFESSTNLLLGNIIEYFGFIYLFIVLGISLFCVYLSFSKFGDVKLGGDDSVPEYSNISWFSMLFSAGMGVGLIFFGVAEPLTHYVLPPGELVSGSKEAIEFAFKTSFFHWGVHPWGVYSFLGLAMAYYQFRKGEKGLLSGIFSPFLKKYKNGEKIKNIIDVLGILATITGVATSLGLGTLQINSGLNYLYGIPNNFLIQCVIVVTVTGIFLASALGSLDKGIKHLSNLNMIFAVLLLLAVLILGPTITIFNIFAETTGNYLNSFLKISLRTGSFSNREWLSSWTIFYWSSWIAWTPFVGSFIARISKGRTIREFVIGVILLPSLFSFIWFSAFGTLGVNLGLEIAKEAVKITETALFIVFNQYRFGSILSLLSIFLLGSFFITSADSATYVLGMMSSDGELNPPKIKKIVWGVSQSLLALALIYLGGLEMLKAASIIIAFPLMLLFPLGAYILYKELKKEPFVRRKEIFNKEIKNLDENRFKKMLYFLKNDSEDRD